MDVAIKLATFVAALLAAAVSLMTFLRTGRLRLAEMERENLEKLRAYSCELQSILNHAAHDKDFFDGEREWKLVSTASLVNTYLDIGDSLEKKYRDSIVNMIESNKFTSEGVEELGKLAGNVLTARWKRIGAQIKSWV